MQTKQRNFDWFSLVVGIVFVIAGIAAYMNPDDTLKFISICIGIGALVKGFYELWFRRGIGNLFGESSGWLLFMGIVDIILGLLFIFRAASGVVVIAYIFAFWFIGFVLLFNPLIAATTLVLIIAFYLILIGIIKIIQAF